jgi:hypothetical protein
LHDGNEFAGDGNDTRAEKNGVQVNNSITGKSIRVPAKPIEE